MDKIFLVGFMGCGKSFIGRRLADLLGFQFVDVDTLIENTEGVTIAQLFENQGETHFRQIETDTLKRLGKWSEVVIATGGGAACFHNNMDWMNANGVTIYLKATPELLLSRLKSEAEKRPLLRGRSEPELLDFIRQKLADREPFYSQATLIVKQNDDGEQVVTDVLSALYDRARSRTEP
jgi:shikimate kinase